MFLAKIVIIEGYQFLTFIMCSCTSDLFAFRHVAGEHGVKVGDGRRQDDLVGVVRKLSNLDGDVTQDLTFPEIFDNGERSVWKVILMKIANANEQ